MDKPQTITLTGLIDTCPHCGYADGFHVSFHQKKLLINIILICPNCHYRYDPTWTLPQSSR